MKKTSLLFIAAFLLGFGLLIALNFIGRKTSTSTYCMSCHAHPEADEAWKQSTHYLTHTAGMRVECVECHLPPKGEGHWPQKIKMGARDIWSHWIKDPESIDWEAKRLVENAVKYIPESSCINCHSVLFSPGLSKTGEEAHLYYKMKKEEKNLHCINCHLHVGHYKEGALHRHNTGFGSENVENKEVFESAAEIDAFENYTETIPETSVSFAMVAINGGSFVMGSPVNEPWRQANEGPQVEVEVSSFFMAEIETTWDMYMAFYLETGREGRTTDTQKALNVDGITGPTPPYGLPDRGWGMGERPAISMSYHAAETFCSWLSQKTQKTYRLPTEAEWEYAARAGTETPYYFEGSPAKFQKSGLSAKLSKNLVEPISTYEVFAENSKSRTQLPERVQANPFGLKHMLGNVSEFTADYYSNEQFSTYTNGIKDPTGPASGKEHVVKGGSYLSPAGDLRCAVRTPTDTENWLKTDPQMPKSIWWYSDCFHVGFRVVCEFKDVNN